MHNALVSLIIKNDIWYQRLSQGLKILIFCVFFYPWKLLYCLLGQLRPWQLSILSYDDNDCQTIFFMSLFNLFSGNFVRILENWDKIEIDLYLLNSFLFLF